MTTNQKPWGWGKRALLALGVASIGYGIYAYGPLSPQRVCQHRFDTYNDNSVTIALRSYKEHGGTLGHACTFSQPCCEGVAAQIRKDSPLRYISFALCVKRQDDGEKLSQGHCAIKHQIDGAVPLRELPGCGECARYQEQQEADAKGTGK